VSATSTRISPASETSWPSARSRACNPATRSADGPMSTPRRLAPMSSGTPRTRMRRQGSDWATAADASDCRVRMRRDTSKDTPPPSRSVISHLGYYCVMDFSYIVLPALIVLGGAVLCWFSIRRMSSLARGRYPTYRRILEYIALCVAVLVIVALATSSGFNAIVLYYSRHPPPG